MQPHLEGFYCHVIFTFEDEYLLMSELPEVFSQGLIRLDLDAMEVIDAFADFATASELDFECIDEVGKGGCRTPWQINEPH